MGHMEAEVGETVLLTNGEDAASEYAMSYLQSFLPVYQMVNQSTISNVADRYKAIRYAADASLALTASGASWSAALGKRLGDEREDDTPMWSSGGDERLATPATVPCLSPVDERVDSSSDSSVSAENDDRRMKRDREALKSVKLSFGSSNVFRLCRRENGRYQRLARSAHRLAILQKLSMKNKCRRRLLRSSRKPRATVRKMKSLASGWRKFARPFQPVDVVEQERNFDSGIVALQRLVPGGSSMDASVLLDEAVDFVMFLKLQVQALQVVASAVDEQFGDAVSTA